MPRPPDAEAPDDSCETYIARWPLVHHTSSTQDRVALYGFRSPWNEDCCRRCEKPLAAGELCLGDNYYDEEVGYSLCMRCAQPLLEQAGVARVQSDGRKGIDQLKVTVLADRCSSALHNPHAVLLGPHSDNGMPRARMHEEAPHVDVVFDAGEPVVIERVKVHNWYVGVYPSRVEVSVCNDLDALEAGSVSGLHPVGIGKLRKASVWFDVDCAATWPTDHAGGRVPFRYVRLRFMEILEPEQHKHMCLGVVLFE